MTRASQGGDGLVGMHVLELRPAVQGHTAAACVVVLGSKSSSFQSRLLCSVALDGMD